MGRLLIRYWFESKEGRGVGVTAFNLDDAVAQIKQEPIAIEMGPNFKDYIENINIQELDQNHVIPNMGICSHRGIWFPNVG